MEFDAAGLTRAAASLGSGSVIGVPTDTVCGVAALPLRSGGATDTIFELKRRPRGLVLPVLVADPDRVKT